MAESENRLENLALDITAVETNKDEQAQVARVYVQLASSYLSGQGAPTITRDCRSLPEFETEIARLKGECDTILAEAKAVLSAEPLPPSDTSAPVAKAGVSETSQKKSLRVVSELLVEDRMTTDIRTMRRNDKLSIAQELMRVGGFRHVLVLEDDEDRLAGVVSHRDIFYSALSWATGRGGRMHEQTLDQVPAKEVMSTSPTTVSPNTPLRDAAATLLEEKIGCLPVLEGDRIVGILTEGDFLSLVTSSSVE